ncbi:hypothetical protein B484DRAFT_431123 [Ochromonadaceae sp. CCMP2298]|nr:hypothetical protein B484DRAFT_431123 [Ochromonadaceae sp. CCMP2298]
MNLSINKPTPGMLPMTYGAHASKSSTNESNQCFVPEMLIEYINELTGQGREALVPSSYFVDGVVLLVDISGFTKLSSSYCDMGKGGIDQLQLATNGYSPM